MKNHPQLSLSENKDYTYALEEILHYCYTMEMDGAERAALTLILLGTAFHIVDYTDYLDFTKDLQSDPDKNRLMRLSNFSDYLKDYADKRLALQEDDSDPYLNKTLMKYQATRTTVKVLEGRGINPEYRGKLSVDDMVSLIGELQENMIIQGLERLSLARAFVDAAFAYAHLAGPEIYQELCLHIQSEMLLDDGKTDMIDIQKLKEERKNPDKNISDKGLYTILAEYSAGHSTTIH